MADHDPSAFTLPLQTAVDRFQRQPGAWGNAYDWYRRGAQRGGTLTFGNCRQLVSGATTSVAARKVGNRWMVDATAFDAALAEHGAARLETVEITKAYDEHRLLVGPSQTLRTSWGGYSVAADFHSSWGSGPRSYGGGYSSWTCSKCWKPATLEHNKEECHTCADWGDCGQDCTLSGIACTDCGTSMTA